MNISRDNHFIPIMYLKNWSSDNKVFVYTLLVSHENVPLWSNKNVTKTGYRSNLYVRVEDGKELDDFEHFFDKEFESKASAPLKKACETGHLNSDDWKAIINFVLLQYVRTPVFYSKAIEIGKKVIPDELDKLGEKFGSLKTLPEKNDMNSFEENLLPLSVKIISENNGDGNNIAYIETVVGKNLWLLSIKSIMSGKSEIKRFFHRMKWSIATAPTGFSFPTSDNPVVFAGKNKNDDHYYLKQSLNDSYVFFPISPDKMLIGSRKRTFQHRFTMSESLYENIVSLITKNALLYVYSQVENNLIVRARKRVVNQEEYERMYNMFNNMYENYKQLEGPYLTKKIKKSSE